MHKTTHCRAPSSQKWEWQNSKIKVVSYSCIQNIIFPKLKSLAPTRPEYVPTLETTINEWRKKKTTKPISFYCWVMGFTGYELLLQYMKASSSALENTFAQGIHLHLPDKLSKLLFYVQLSCLTVNWNNASGKKWRRECGRRERNNHLLHLLTTFQLKNDATTILKSWNSINYSKELTELIILVCSHYLGVMYKTT